MIKNCGLPLNFKNQNEMLYIFTGLIYFVIYKTVTSALSLLHLLNLVVVTDYARPLVVVLKGPPCLNKDDLT